MGLAEHGHSVEVVTGQPSYSSKKRLPRRENLQGVRIHRIFKLQFARERAVGRIVSAVSFFLSAFSRLLRMSSKPLLVIGSDPPFLPFLGWIFRKFRGQEYVLIISDIYPDVAVALGELAPSGWMTRVLEWTNRIASKEARKIVVLGERMKERILERFLDGNNSERIEVIHNWANENEIGPVVKENNRFRYQHGLNGRLVCLFSGNLGKIYSFGEILEAASLLKGGSTEFVFIGDGPVRTGLEKKAARLHLENIRFLPYQPKGELRYSLTSGDVAILPLKKEVTGLCVPGKFYWALAGGLPVLVVASEECEISRIVRENDCGWSVSPGHPEEVASLLAKIAEDRSLLTEKSKNARRCFETYYTRRRTLLQYEGVFSGV